jgi:hypothetical protein
MIQSKWVSTRGSVEGITGVDDQGDRTFITMITISLPSHGTRQHSDNHAIGIQDTDHTRSVLWLWTLIEPGSCLSPERHVLPNKKISETVRRWGVPRSLGDRPDLSKLTPICPNLAPCQRRSLHILKTAINARPDMGLCRGHAYRCGMMLAPELQG